MKKNAERAKKRNNKCQLITNNTSSCSQSKFEGTVASLPTTLSLELLETYLNYHFNYFNTPKQFTNRY